MGARRESSPFRIAIRGEGPMVNAYLAPIGTMEGAQLVGSISKAACEADRALFERFQTLMTELADVLVRQVMGRSADRYDVRDAPEHEKAGNA